MKSIGKIDCFRSSRADTISEDEDNKGESQEIVTDDCIFDRKSNIYPPADRNIIKPMASYLQENKRIPLEIERDFSSCPTRLLTSNKTCYSCKENLALPFITLL